MVQHTCPFSCSLLFLLLTQQHLLRALRYSCSPLAVDCPILSHSLSENKQAQGPRPDLREPCTQQTILTAASCSLTTPSCSVAEQGSGMAGPSPGVKGKKNNASLIVTKDGTTKVSI